LGFRSVSSSNGLVPVACLAAFATAPVNVQRAGQSVSVQYGVATGARDVDLGSNAAPAGARDGQSVCRSGSGRKLQA